MKKILIVLGVCSIILACNSAEKSESTEDTTSASEQVTVDKGAVSVSTGSAKGEQLISGSDCLTCHKVDVKIVGPSYIDVANKYEATDTNIEMLAGKIINGGSGSWGEIPMAPHSALSSDDAKEMVKYILSLKTN